MAQQITADGGNERETKRFTDDVSLDDVVEGDRIDPAIVPHTPGIEVGEPVQQHSVAYDSEDDREYSVRLVAGGEDRWSDVQTALIYDPEADLFAYLSGHTKSGAMNQKERDWKVRDVGRQIVVEDTSDEDLQEYEDDYDDPQTFVEEWVEILADEIRQDGDYDEIEQFEGSTFKLLDWDNRKAWVEYHLESEDDE